METFRQPLFLIEICKKCASIVKRATDAYGREIFGSMGRQRANMIAAAKFLIESLETGSQVQSRPGLPDPRSEELMQIYEKFPHHSALASGGSVYFPRRGENARLSPSESLKGLAIELRSQFVVTYTPTNQARDGKERNLRIELGETFDGKRTAAIKATFVVTLSK